MEAMTTNHTRSVAACVIGALLPLPASALAAQHSAAQHRAAAESVLAVAQRAAALIPDTAAARAAGYVPIEELGIPDRNPFQGQHWYNGTHSDTLQAPALETPAFVMFAPVNGALQRVAVAYAKHLRIDTAVLPGLGEDSTAMWHSHVLC